MKKITKILVDPSKIQSFKEWWEDHKTLYVKQGIDKDTAYTIWVGAIDAFMKGVREV